MKFEDYLIERHAASYTGLDDDMPEAWDQWIADMPIENCIEYADQWMLNERRRMADDGK